MVATRGREIHIPLSIHLEALCLPKLQQAWLLLMPYLPELGALNPRVDPEGTIRQAIKGHLAFANKDLIEYLQKHPKACEELLREAKEKREGAAAFMEEAEGGKYRVGRVGAAAEARVFGSLPEAAADYVLVTWGFPRLSQEEAKWEEGASS